PDGKSVVFAANVNRNQMMFAEGETSLFTVSASGGEPKQITPAGQRFSRPKFSPAGDALYAQQEQRAKPGGRLYSLTRLAKFSWPSIGAPTIMTQAWDRSVGDIALSPDGRAVYIDAEDDGFDQVFQIPAQGGGQVQRLFKVERGGYTAVTPIAGGLAALYQTSIQPA